MKHTIHRVTSFERVGEYRVNIRFADGLTRTIDFEPVLEGEIFGPLRNPVVFARLRLDTEVGTLVWPNGADFDPATLHDWPEHEPAFRAAALRWKNAVVGAGR
jgi:hypothetical protein